MVRPPLKSDTYNYRHRLRLSDLRKANIFFKRAGQTKYQLEGRKPVRLGIREEYFYSSILNLRERRRGHQGKDTEGHMGGVSVIVFRMRGERVV
jgi:hypothetical protein